MLKADPHDRYYIYPSWGPMQLAWEELHPLLDDPVRSGYLDPNALRRFEKEPNAFSIHPFEMLSGAVGGGVIIAHAPPGMNWLPEDILWRCADFEKPNGMQLARHVRNESVCYLTSHRFRCTMSGFKIAANYGPVASTLEHLELAGERVFWVIEHTIKDPHPWAGELDPWARVFGIQVEPFNPTLDIVDATKTWFLGNDRTYSWYRVRGGRDTVGYQFAVLVYIAAHLQMIAGRRFRSMVLTAGLEGKPNIRSTFHLRPDEYDESGRVIASTDSAGNRFTFQYDGAGRLISVTDHNGIVRQLP